MMQIQKLLFVTKFRELWFDALASLLELREVGLNHVVFLNVIERDKVALRRGTGYQKTEEIRLREKTNIRFIDWAENLYEQGMEVGAYIVVGSLAKQTLDTARKEEADLIIIGRPKKGKFEKFYSGSDVAEIIQRSQTPVLVYKYLSYEGQEYTHPFARPLLATDWSAACLRAVDYLKVLSPIVQDVNIIHVVDDKNLKNPSAMMIQKARKETRQKLEAICDSLETEGINARARVYAGNTMAEIERAAQECQATMIIAGTSGRGSWKDRWVGDIPRLLAEKSILPTLLIPPQ